MRAITQSILALAILTPTAAVAMPRAFYSDGSGATAQVRQSIELCTAAEAQAEQQRRATIKRGLALAEAALAEREADARAQFALFCHLARRAELEGVSVGAVATVARMEAAVDRALELEPRYLDALIGKGLLLIELPWVLGGDEDRGEELLRWAVALDADFAPARERLAIFLEEEGRLDEMPEAVRRAGQTADSSA